MLTIDQQIINALKKSEKPLIIFKQHFTGDSIAAAVSFYLLLQKINKQADIVCCDFSLPKAYQFLPASDKIKSELSTLRKMIISIDANKTKIDEFHYNIKGDQLKIYLAPKKGFFGPQDIRATASKWKYDLIITVDSPDLDSLGKVYSDNREFFYQTPIINIDHSPANEQFGQMNLEDSTCSSTCGVIYDFIKSWDEKFFDSDINTCLLTGIIDKTKGFKAGMINPKTLQMSGQLIENKARREEIVKNLYYNKNVSTLKLWGRVLNRLKEYYNGKLVTASVSLDDFKQTNTTSENLPEIMDELISAIPEVDLIILIYQKDSSSIGIIIKSLGNFNPPKVLATLKPVGDKNLTKIVLKGNDPELAEQQIVEEIKKSYQPEY